MLDSAYQKALDSLLITINQPSGITHPNDLKQAVALFVGLLGRGRVVEHSDQIVDYLRSKNSQLSSESIREITLIYQTLACYFNKDYSERIRPSFFDKLME